MQIREISVADNAQIKQIIQHSLKQEQLDIPGTAYFDPQLNDLYHYYQGIENAAYWVIVDDTTVLGGIGIAPLNPSDGQHICELQKLYLSDDAKGHGLSKQLMTIALDYAAQRYDQCYLETMAKLKPACALYEKFGFTPLKQPLNGSEHSAMDRWYLKVLK
ncbi:GNAT family N-acetyltransferase [Weissella minor]|uniref:GNAT family N-acetyltransferase n=1 Tax=Weissella minor TaxID=1620 RepID=UPI001BAE7790|nr:GNAT family N-acetyltransferase [Weissella minor]MBS0949082.1 GNAT family N-acetyltransferase [Weissella minor]